MMIDSNKGTLAMSGVSKKVLSGKENPKGVKFSCYVIIFFEDKKLHKIKQPILVYVYQPILCQYLA